jgi:hypothetical protein
VVLFDLYGHGLVILGIADGWPDPRNVVAAHAPTHRERDRAARPAGGSTLPAAPITKRRRSMSTQRAAETLTLEAFRLLWMYVWGSSRLGKARSWSWNPRSSSYSTQQLRRLRPGLEVLFMSGYNDSRLVTRGVEDANVNLLVKPFTPDELFAAVAGRLTAAPA